MLTDQIHFSKVSPDLLIRAPAEERIVRFPNALAEFVYTRTYARWIPEEKRRETWPETVARYFSFMKESRKIPDRVFLDCYNAVMSMGVMPSMRALWCAGPAMKRDNTCSYNCSFLPIDSLCSFSEVLYILMQGTGVGFSVENKFVSRLPVINKPTGDVVSYNIPDSTVGWAEAFYFGLQQWWRGTKVEFDYSQIRPKGAILHTKGGRASGPEPLQRLLEFGEKTVMGAGREGRKLRSIECHDMVCQIADIVIVGGHRRSSLISFSDVDDQAMRHAKDFQRGEFPQIRHQANNSVFYAGRPEEGLFREEWTQLVNSRSGERGFSIDNWWKYSDIRPQEMIRSNPCVTGDTRVMTAQGFVKIKDFVGQQKGLVIDTRLGAEVSLTTDRGAFKTGTRDVMKLKTVEGYQLRLTHDHLVMTSEGWIEAKHLKPGMHVHIANHGGGFGGKLGSEDLGMLAGWLAGDGSLVDGNVPRLYFYHEDRVLLDRMLDAAERVTGSRPSFSEYEPSKREHFQCVGLREYMGQSRTKVPEFVWQGTQECQRAYISALFSADGGVQGCAEKGFSIRLHSVEIELLREVQQLLLNFGIASKIYRSRMKEGMRPCPDGNGGLREYECRESHELAVTKVNLKNFAEKIGFILERKQQQAEAVVALWTKGPYGERFLARIESVESDGVEDVYDLTEPVTHSFIANGIVVHNCHEIGLKFSYSDNPVSGDGGAGQFCNLTACVMRAHDTQESMLEKVRLATWLGVLQATFTEFPHLRDGWKKHCDEDRLLGVDITGQCDNPALSRDTGFMKRLNLMAVETAREASSYFGVNMPAAITCGKPSGNSSQLLNCSSGFHTRHDHYYYRHVRINASDPLFYLVRDEGLPVFKENKQEHLPDDEVDTWVVRFPVKSPPGSITRNDETAISQCKRYLQVMKSWCSEHGHNQSATIYVRDHEWEEVGNWLWDNFDEVTGLSFLPYDGGNYRLPPYKSISREEYKKEVADFPEIDFSKLGRYEEEDRTEGARELACTSGSCEI